MTGGDDFRKAFGTDEFVDAYTDLLVPRLFQPWAEALVERVAPAPGSAALDVACGPGTVTRLLARRVGAAGRAVGADLSAPMLARARAAGADTAGAARIEWLEAPADRLPLPDAAFDTVTCQQGLQFFPDRDAAAAEWRRVIRSGGSIAVACWCDLEQCRPYADMARALEGLLGRERVEALRMPFSYGDADAIRRLLDRHGFTEIEAAVEGRPLVAEGGVGMVWRMIGATPLAPGMEAIADRDALLAARTRLTESLADITDDDGTVHGTFHAAVVVARAA